MEKFSQFMKTAWEKYNSLEKPMQAILIIFVAFAASGFYFSGFWSGLASACSVSLLVYLAICIYRIVKKQDVKIYIAAFVIFCVAGKMFAFVDAKINDSFGNYDLEIVETTTVEDTTYETTTEQTTTETTTETTIIIVTTTTQTTTVKPEVTTAAAVQNSNSNTYDASASNTPAVSNDSGYSSNDADNNVYDNNVSDSSDEVVYISRTGSKYHRQNCRTLKGNGIQSTLSEALSMGLEPCGVCHP